MRVGQSKYARAQFGLPQMNFLMLTCAILLFQIFEIFFQALGKVSLTPVIGAGLLGTAAHDALGTGAVGTMVKAKELIYKVQEGDAEDVGGEDEVEVGSISETVNKSAERAAATPIEIFDPDTKCQGPNIYAKTTSRRAFHSSYASQMAKQSRMHLRRS